MKLILGALLTGAAIAIACGGGNGLDELGIAEGCNPEGDAPARASGDTFTTKGGVSVVVVTEAPEPNPAQVNDEIAIHYRGLLADGTPFDDSRALPGGPFEFGIHTDNVLCGWVEGIVGISPGELRVLTIPPELAYGSRGLGDLIPEDATLVFEIEMIEFVQPSPAE